MTPCHKLRSAILHPPKSNRSCGDLNTAWFAPGFRVDRCPAVLNCRPRVTGPSCVPLLSSALFSGLSGGQVTLTAFVDGFGTISPLPAANVFTNHQLHPL